MRTPKPVKKAWRFVRQYTAFCIALITATTALIFDISYSHYVTHWILGVTVVVLVLPILWDIIQTLREGRYGVDILAATAIITSVILGQYWAGMVIVLMYTGGKTLENYAERRAQIELDALLKRAPQRALVLRKNREIEIPIAEVHVGDKIIVKPGDVVPVDGVIVEGSASFDESSLTGESLPVAHDAGDQILSGSVNIDGAITLKCSHIAADSQYAQILKLVRTAAASQAPIIRLADRYAVPFTIIAYAIGITTWVLSGHVIQFLEVLVVATPCPLILAAPIAVISGISRAARQGIIVKNGGALERFAGARTIAFDKTGTLTEGIPKVDQIVTFGSYKKVDVLGIAASLEQGSNHVLAQAIQEAALARKAHTPKAKHIKEVSGKGLMATISGRHILVGRFAFIQEADVELPPTFKPSSVQSTATFVAEDGKLIGYITFIDTIRSESKFTLGALHRLGMREILMVTGDTTAVAKSVARKLDIDTVVSEALPADKLIAIEHIEDRPVAFVGDGVNDAPVLTAADIGIALGARGSTAASESADMVIMQNDISKVAVAFAIARRTFAIARQSILVGIALSIALMIIFASGAFKPIYGAVVQEIVDVIVILNALRAHSNKPIRL